MALLLGPCLCVHFHKKTSSVSLKQLFCLHNPSGPREGVWGARALVLAACMIRGCTLHAAPHAPSTGGCRPGKTLGSTISPPNHTQSACTAKVLFSPVFGSRLNPVNPCKRTMGHGARWLWAYTLLCHALAYCDTFEIFGAAFTHTHTPRHHSGAEHPPAGDPFTGRPELGGPAASCCGGGARTCSWGFNGGWQRVCDAACTHPRRSLP